jgi:hypothetical protein
MTRRAAAIAIVVVGLLVVGALTFVGLAVDRNDDPFNNPKDDQIERAVTAAAMRWPMRS